MWSSCLQRSPAPTIIHDLPKVVESTNVSKEPVGENASKVHTVFSTPPQRKEEGKKRGLNYLSEKTDVSNQPAKKRKCRPRVADDKFSLTTKKAKVIPKPVKGRRASPKKDSQRKRMYVRKKKQQLNVVVHPPKATCDVVGRDDVVFKETLLVSDTSELFKAACQRALVFNDENLTHMSAFTPQVIDVAPEPPSPEDGKFCEKAVQPPLRREENLNNHEAEERYVFSDDFPNLAESKYFTGASKETLDYEAVNTVSTTLDMSEPYIDMELKDLESLRLERDSLKEEIVYVRKRKTQPSINIQHNFCFMEATSTEEVRANERAQSVHGGSVLDSDGWKIITVSCMKGLDSGVVNDMSISQTNENKKRAISSSDYKNEDRFVILHVPLISNGRNMRACQCIQLMRKSKSSKVKIKKQRRMLRKQRVDMSRLISSFQIRKQLTSKKPISQYQKVSIPTRRPRSKFATRPRDILSILTGPPFNKLATHTVEQQSSLQVPQIDILPTHDQPPLLDPTYNNNQLLNHVQLGVTNEHEFIREGRGGLQTIEDPDHQILLYKNQLHDPHREPSPTTGNNSVNSHFLVPYYEPSELLHGQELLSRVDNSIGCFREETVLNDTSNQALVASVKKKKVIPHVNFDSKTMPMWRALMGKGDSCDHQCNENEESKKWWHEERRVFKEKIQAFIYCMHQIQGNRRFSQWKGSVLDSVMGVFLTQNVSDHLSSSAYMSLASKYPIEPQPTHGQKVASEEIEVDDKSCGRNVVSITELLVQESLNDRILDGEQAALQSVRTDSRNEFGERNPVKDNIVIPTVGLCGFEEWLSQQEQVIQPQDSSHPKSGRKDFLSQLEQNTSPQTPSHPNSETGELHSQPEYTTQLHPLSHSNSESTEPNQKEQTTETQNSFHPKSETDELPFHHEKRKRHQDSTHPKTQKSKAPVIDWLKIKTKYCKENREISKNHRDSVDWDAVRRAPNQEVADAIKKRGQHNILAASMQNALNRIFSELGSLDLEWLRDTPPDVTKNFLLSIEGLGLKSVECIRLLALEQVAFPVDTNVGRIAVRLGWVDLKDVPEGQQFHLLDQYPMMDAIQQYLWPRLCELDQLTLYELHYQMITFGKIFCKKRSPYCNECPLRASCKHFASAYVSACLPITDGANAGTPQSLPLLGPYTEMPASPQQSTEMPPSPQPCFEIPTMPQPYTEMHTQVEVRESMNPTVEFPRTPESEHEDVIEDIEDLYTDASEIPSIVLNDEEFIANVSKYIDGKKFKNGAEISNAIVISAQAARIPARKLKNIKDLRTEHLVYEIPDDHPLLPLHGLGERDLNDPCFYLLSILSPDESMTLSSENVKENSYCLPENHNSKEGCIENDTCQQHDVGHVFGTFMIPCRTAMKGRFPLNGTYFQVNEVFADDESSHRPVKIPRSYLWNLEQRIVYCGSSASAIATGLSIKEIQVCFWKDYVCVRGINRRTGEPKELVERLHRLRTATQTKRSSGTVQLNPKRKRNKLGSQ